MSSRGRSWLTLRRRLFELHLSEPQKRRRRARRQPPEPVGPSVNWRRWMLVSVAFGGGVVILMAIALATFDANHYKQELRDLGSEMTGREVDIRGDIELQLGLHPRLTVAGVSLGNPQWASEATMFDVAHLEIRVNLLPLLRHRVEMTHIVVHDATLRLEKDSQGQANWAFGPPAEIENTAAERPNLRWLDVREISLRNSRVEYREPDREPIVVLAERIELTPDGYNEPLRLRAKLDYQAHTLQLAALLAPLPRLFANDPYEVDLRANIGDFRLETTGTLKHPLDISGVDFDFQVTVHPKMFMPAQDEDDFVELTRWQIHGRLHDDGDQLLFDAVDASSGASRVTAKAVLRPWQNPPELNLSLNSELLDLTPYVRSTRTPGDQPKLFSATPIPFDYLVAINVELEANVEKLKLPSSELRKFRMRTTILDGTLDVSDLSAQIGRGGITAKMRVVATDELPALSYALTVSDVASGALMSEAAAKLVRGGQVDVDLNIDSKGKSAAELAANANGNVLISLRNMDFLSESMSTVQTDLALKAFRLLNPRAGNQSRDTIECAVVNFPLTNGIARNKTAIGITTTSMSILGGGHIDLKSERIDIGVNPKPRDGIGLNVAGLVDFIRIGGTLTEPHPTTDAAGVAMAGLKAGAAVATGGLSILAEGLVDRAQAKTNACEIAAGTAALVVDAETDQPSALEAAGQRSSDALKEAGKSVKGAFNRLFGD